jgi:putative radical SAM enzyme (TIGR03279 family)
LLEIENILPDSTASRLGLKPGDCIGSINGLEVRDVIDYQYLVSEERITLVLHPHAGRPRTLTVDKEPDDTLGLEFSPFHITRCRNRCIFCFVDQMPPGCRRSLYIKDDDYRASFLYGNYITLGALSESDWERIFSQRLTPLYISVHATEPALRSFMLRNQKAPDIMKSLKRLSAGGIRMHTQIVLCPGINDGPHLLKTMEDLSGLFPAVSSIAVVPVGITAFRKGLTPLRAFTRREARTVVETVQATGMRFKRRHGSRLAFASDEFYIKAGMPFPSVSYYEDFPQRENGVGMVAAFLQETACARLPKSLAPLKVTLTTGVSFSAILKRALEKLKLVDGVHIAQVTVENRFFGPSVTVAGLLTGGDILRSLKGKRLGELILVPENALRDDDDVFLDGMTLRQLERSLDVRIAKVGSFTGLIRLLCNGGRGA